MLYGKHAPRDTDSEYLQARLAAVHQTDHKGVPWEQCLRCQTLLADIRKASELTETRQIASDVMEAAAETEMKRRGFL